MGHHAKAKVTSSSSPSSGRAAIHLISQRAKVRQAMRGIQTKLRLGPPGDAFEQEADRVADAVMHGEKDTALSQAEVPPIQRACKQCPGTSEDEEELLQPKPAAGGLNLQGTAEPLTSAGQPLPENTRQFFESRFSCDLRDVRVHADSKSAMTAEQINARAFTHGTDIAFGQGEYAPETATGRHLLAHELTHVMQQGGVAGKKGITVDQGVKGTVQRRLNDGHDLTSTRFARNAVLEAVYDNERLLQRGSQGTAVRLVQESLLAQGYALPRFGADGIFGAETEAAVRLFQIDTGAEKLDGIIGPETMTLLNIHDTGTSRTTRPAAGVGPAAPPAATAAAFREHPQEQFAGFDDSTAPHWLVVPENGRRHAQVVPTPANSLPAYVTASPAVATVEPTADGVVVTGVADGHTTVEARDGATTLARLNVEVKRRMDHSVDFHFMRDSAVPPHATTRAEASADPMTSTLNRIWERQANVRFRKGTVNSPVIPGDLGGQVLWTATLPNEWDTVVAFATGGDYNVFLVWEYEQDATPLVDNVNAGTLNNCTLLEDNECGDALTVAHEAGHFLNMAMPHTAAGIMSGCPGAERRRVRKAIADLVNP